MDQYLGEIQLYAFGFAPQGWANCNGQLLPINQNQALFSLLGTTYGGNGTVNFALPNLQGKSMVHFGQSIGTSNYALGQTSGSTSVSLAINNMQAHTHTVNVGVNTAVGTTAVATTNIAGRANGFIEDAEVGSFLGGVTSGSTGQNQPFSIANPFLGINHCIALQGIFPSRP